MQHGRRLRVQQPQGLRHALHWLLPGRRPQDGLPAAPDEGPVIRLALYLALAGIGLAMTPAAILYALATPEQP